MRVYNYIREALLWKPTVRSLSRIDTIVIHRLGLSVGRSYAEVIAAFKDTSRYGAGSYTGGKFPYHLWLPTGPAGTAFQMLPLDVKGSHAVGYNRRSIGIALAGDFTEHPPTSSQLRTLETLCTVLSFWRGSLKIIGHTDDPRATRVEDKVCPGEHLSVKDLSNAVSERLTRAQTMEKQVHRDMIARAFGLSLSYKAAKRAL